MIWNDCREELPIIHPRHSYNGCEMTTRVLTWSEKGGYNFACWVSDMGWIDSDDSLGTFDYQPTHWISIDNIDYRWYDTKTLKPNVDGIYLMWYEEIKNEDIGVLGEYRNGKWYYKTSEYEIKDINRPILWMRLPKPPPYISTGL